MKITKSAVDKLTNGFIWDDELKGFGVRCQGKGKFYILKFRIGKRQRWYTIGRHGSPWTPQQARDEATRLLGLIVRGVDPMVEKDRNRDPVTLKELVAKYLPHARARLKASTVNSYERLLDKNVIPHMGHYRINDILPADVAKLHDRMSSTPSQANISVRVLSAVFRWAIKRGMCDKNPCNSAVEPYEEKPKQRFLSPEEFQRLGKALEIVKAEHPFFAYAIYLLTMTGCRKNEIMTLRWSYIDWNADIIRLPDSKTGAKEIYLNSETIALLHQIPRIEGNPHVICGSRDGDHLKGGHKLWDRVRKLAGLPGVRQHDLRHSYASIAVGQGLSLHMIGKLLGHADTKSTEIYAHLARGPMVVASDSVGVQIAALLGTSENISKEAA